VVRSGGIFGTTRGFGRAFVFAAVAAVLAGCGATSYSWGWHVIIPETPQGRANLAFLIDGLWMTVMLSVVSIMAAVVLGMIVAMCALSPNKALNWINRIYVEGVRAVPLLVLLLWVYYGLPVVMGLQLGVFMAGVVSLALSDSAFEAEIFRAGIQSIAKGQSEAAYSVGLSKWHTFRLVVLPQAIRRILPALGNQFVYVLKMSSLISVIGAQELTRKATELIVIEPRPLEIYTFLVIEYLLLILLVSWLVRRMEKKMAQAGRQH